MKSLLALASLRPGSCVVKVGLSSATLWIADGGDMIAATECQEGLVLMKDQAATLYL